MAGREYTPEDSKSDPDASGRNPKQEDKSKADNPDKLEVRNPPSDLRPPTSDI